MDARARTPGGFGRRLELGLATTLLVFAAGCSGGDHRSDRGDDNEIVFGIAQVKGADGKVTTSASWSILALGSKGSSYTTFYDDSRACVIENVAQRVGRPSVDHGLATFRGGTLPPNGLAMIAGQADEPSMDGAGWATGDVLTFESTGFAAPDVGPLRIPAASVELTLKTPADGPLTVPRGADLEVTWDPGPSPAPPDSVLVALDTDTDQEIRCFYDRAAGTGAVPNELLAKLPAGAKGTLAVETQRQAAGYAGHGAWAVYVVSTVQHRAQPFVLDP
jgi:hypothetical protein